ncbi:uncharacterized protein LOC129580633 [Paramacrobiotus metropolitanus]|uniref:uncharacterized protein LOC129580633 n=1 Tax=Paramacrobiotus metropolitanus TaxID=2943436 RepID=UPI00244614C4|nr:uncharacterized protein LOC129580633 [Paramacrobiotus metropolitanus]
MLTAGKLDALMESADVIASARPLAVSTKNASAWLFALPVASLGTLLDDAGLRIAVALRMGAPVCKEHKCRCGEMVDAFGLHGLSCIRSQGRFRRHASLNSVIQRSLGSAKVPTILEPPGLSRLDGKRPDGLSLFPWKNGLPLIWDVTVVDTFATSYVASSSEAAGSAADDAETRKRNLYSELTDRHFFEPIALETMGSCGGSTRHFINEVGRRIKEQTGEARATEFLWQRLSVEIQRGNAASVLGTVGCSKQLEELFFLF